MTLGSGFGGIAKAFESRNYRIFWIGNLTHTITVWVNRLALGWLTWELTHSPFWLGLMAASGMLPTVFLGPVGGVTADRFGHRAQLIAATYSGAAIGIVITVLVASDLIFEELLLGLVILSGITRAFNVPARIAMIHSLVEKRYLASAIGVNSATYYGGNFVGPALAGVLITNFGISWAIFAYACGELIAATSFLLLKIDRPPPRRGGRTSLFADFNDGFQYTRSHNGILALLILAAVMAIFLNPYMDMLPGFASDVFNRDARGLAMLTASTGAGAVIGALWIARRGRMEGLVRIELTSLGLAMMAMFGFVATDHMGISVAALFLVGLFLVTAHVCGTTLIQNAVEPQLRARVISFSGVINVSGPAVGALIIGWAATMLGLRLPVAGSTGLAFLIFLAAARFVARNALPMEAGIQQEIREPGY